MTVRILLMAAAAPMVLSGALAAEEKTRPLVVWPGYLLELPADHCVRTQNGPDFHVLYVCDRRAPKTILAGVYCGFAPDFAPACKNPAKRTWTANGLSFKSVRGAEGCAEFLVQDPSDARRGSLDIWFGPEARDHPNLAEALIASVRPAQLPLGDVPDPPACEEKPSASRK